MRLRVLGSAAGGGFPQWNCGCPNCRRARKGDPAAKPRTQSSLAASADGRRFVLLNAAPDLTRQIDSAPALQPAAARRDSPIAGVILTSADVDHVAGLLSLREGQALAIYATARVLAVLAENNIFDVLAAERVKRRELKLGEGVAIADADGAPVGLTVEAFSVPGKVALYRENAGAGPGFGTQPGDVVGLRVAAADQHFFYLPGCAAMPEELARRLRGARLVFFDGTLWRDDEMITLGLGSKTGKRMGHMSVSGKDGAIAAFKPLAVERKVFIHINNSNPILIAGSPERAEVEAAGWEVAEDGMEIDL